jgi:hypothetical protein
MSDEILEHLKEYVSIEKKGDIRIISPRHMEQKSESLFFQMPEQADKNRLKRGLLKMLETRHHLNRACLSALFRSENISMFGQSNGQKMFLHFTSKQTSIHFDKAYVKDILFLVKNSKTLSDEYLEDDLDGKPLSFQRDDDVLEIVQNAEEKTEDNYFTVLYDYTSSSFTFNPPKIDSSPSLSLNMVEWIHHRLHTPQE